VLTPQEYEALVLYYNREMPLTQKQVADILNVTRNTVANRVGKAIQKIRAKWEET
jgi:RNA polymerase sigma factor (sigma-70 family)